MHWAHILDAVEQGKEFAITKYGSTVASITPPRKKKPKASPPPGFLYAEGWRMQVMEDFDAVPKGFEDYV